MSQCLLQSIVISIILLLGTNSSRASDRDFTNCPIIDGEYLSSGISSSSFSDYYKRPTLHRNIFAIDNPKHIVHSVLIEPDNNQKQIYLEFRDINKFVIQKKEWKEEFKCSNGWIVFESFVEGSSVESSVLSTYTLTKISRHSNNSLVVITKLETVYRSWGFFKKKRLFEVRYTFSSIE